MIRLGGLPFEVVPGHGLSPAERRSLSRLPADDRGRPGARPAAAGSSSGPAPDTGSPAPFVLELLEGFVVAPGAAPGPVPGGAGDDDAPAAVDWERGRVTIRHRRLVAELDPAARAGWLRRDRTVGWPLEVTLRTALAARLPLEGGIPLHAAGLVMGGRGVAFFGPSGAGKSTLAAASPHPVVSDEMVAIAPAGPGGYVLGGTGFWGTFDGGETPCLAVPLGALVELDRGPAVRVDSLDPTTALRRLVASALVPPGPPLWSAALATLGRLARRVPVLRLAWTPDEPWGAIEDALRRAGALGPRVPRG